MHQVSPSDDLDNYVDDSTRARAEARRFLSLLDPSARSFTFQTFHDRYKGQDENVSLARSTSHRDEVLRLYGQGAGVYVTVNETDLTGRKSANIKRVRAIWQEDDEDHGGPFPLDPSVVVESSPGHYHRYWLVSDHWPADEQGRADFAAVMERMVASYGCDHLAKDLCRVLRLPGFLHRKDPARPHMVRIIHEGGRRYSRDQIVRAFPPVERETQRTQWHSADCDEERIADALRVIPADDRDIWLQVGMALKDVLGERGRGLWDNWSASSSKFNPKDQEKTWRSFKRNGIGIGTIFWHAKRNGWSPQRREKRGGNEGNAGTGGPQIEWPEPKALPSGLPPVDPFDLAFMPDALRPWIDDTANRLQCPPEYVGVTAIVALGSVIGRRVGIKPQRKTDWVEVPNIWGAFIGRPGMLKSPAMGEALKPIHHLEAEAAKDNELARQAYEAGLQMFKLKQDVAKALTKSKLKKDGEAKIEIDLSGAPQEPLPVRYRTNDTTYEGLGELLIANPSGILVERDELVSLIQFLDREDQAVARGFYLSGWSGTQPYTFDRIGRGQRHIEAVCVSVLGNTQPARIVEYVRKANAGGAGGDGMIQRFGLLVWPDAPRDWRNVDEYPDSAARAAAWDVFDRAAKINMNQALAMGATMGRFDRVPSFRFDEAAHDDFLGWRSSLEQRLRHSEMSPALEGHLAKHRKLVPALALINHVADHGDGPVTQSSLLKALAFAEYLESHARRVYRSSSEGEASAASAILKHIRVGDLPDGFTARDILRHGWAHLTDREQLVAGLNLLVELDHLAAVESAPIPHGGRPKTTYRINPRSIQQ